MVERQPFGGPLFVRFGDDVHPLGGELARAMRVEVTAPVTPSLRVRHREPALEGAAADGRAVGVDGAARSSGCSPAAACGPR